MISKVYMICDAYESGFGHGLQRDGKSDGSFHHPPEHGEAYEIGYRAGEKRAALSTQPAAPSPAVPMSEQDSSHLAACAGDRVQSPLTEDQILAAIQSVGEALHGRIALTYESGPYDIDRPTVVATQFARAIEATHGILAIQTATHKSNEINDLGVKNRPQAAAPAPRNELATTQMNQTSGPASEGGPDA